MNGCPLIIALNAPGRLYVGYNVQRSEIACGLEYPHPDVQSDIHCFRNIRNSQTPGCITHNQILTAIANFQAANSTNLSSVESQQTATSAEVTFIFNNVSKCIEQYGRLIADVTAIAIPRYRRTSKGWCQFVGAGSKAHWRRISGRNKNAPFLNQDQGVVILWMEIHSYETLPIAPPPSYVETIASAPRCNEKYGPHAKSWGDGPMDPMVPLRLLYIQFRQMFRK